MDPLPSVSIVTVLHNWEDFYGSLKHQWDIIDYPKEKLEWIIVDDSKEKHSHLMPLDDNILYIKVNPDEYLDKIEFKKDEDKIIWNYHNIMKILPIGFKRDYAVGMTSHEYIFHMDVDTYYQPKAIKRKVNFLQKQKLECVYCKSMLCYDIYNDKIYKTENSISGYPSTLCYTKQFWEKGGFEWSDTTDDSSLFYYNKGLDRVLDNYYDTVKLLSVHNMNIYQPKEISIENLEISIPEYIKGINIEKHPVSEQLYDLFYDQKDKEIQVISINSEIIKPLSQENWNVTEIEYKKKEKEKSLIKKIKETSINYQLCVLNVSFPIWNLFKSVKFPYLIIENMKNREQMHHILLENKYHYFENIYINIDSVLENKI